MADQNNSQNPFYNEQADQKWTTPSPKNDNDNVTNDIKVNSPAKNSRDPDSLVRQNEDASLQDKQYAFDEDNTGNEEYHDAVGGEDAGDHAFDI